MFTQRGGVCNTGNSDKKYGGMHEDASVTVQGEVNLNLTPLAANSGLAHYISI